MVLASVRAAAHRSASHGTECPQETAPVLTSAGTDDSRTYFDHHGSSGSMGSYSYTRVDEIENAIGKTFSFDNHMFEPYNFRHESGSFVTGEMTKNTTYYKDLSGEELAERYLTQDQGTVLWRVAASVEGKYGSYTREDSYLMYAWPAAGNYASIVTGFFAYYFYFVLSFDVANLYVQVCKLFIDLQVIFRHFPWWSIVTVCWLLFNRWRKNIALNRLRHYEARNCGFINELPIVSMACGSMGKRKTTLITDMVLSQEAMFRQKALETLQNNDMKFPYFPWIAFEDELRRCMEHGTVYNLASVKTWVALKRTRFARHHNIHWQIYGYELERYEETFDDALKVNGLFEVLETYAMAYFIYVLESSLIVANYSIRTDNQMQDNGNFPLWLTDFFPKQRRDCSRHAHILDFDVLRLGRKVLENNPRAGSFEFGVVAITEIGKERGNNLELREIKKGSDDTNQKNDLFNSWLKMCRHSATVDNFPFIKVFTDEQRPESWGADARDLADIINIASCGELRLALPFYTIEEMISEWTFNRFMRLYEDFRFRCGDNTLLVHILKSVTAWLWRRDLRMHNKYGYCILKIEKERGTMDGKTENK